MTTPQLESMLTCPECGHAVALVMPTDACRFFHECAACHVLLRPLVGDCCVFCSYGSAACPSVQEDGNSCKALPKPYPMRRSADD
ncbi:MAG: GDCCVxC domain-containing (seleno)protein [bacterium]